MGGVLWVQVTLGSLFMDMVDPDDSRHLRVKRRYGAALGECLTSLFMWVSYPRNLVGVGGDNIAPPQLLQLHILDRKCSVLMKVKLNSLPENAEKTDIEDMVMLHNIRPDFIKRVRVIRIVS